MILILCFLVVTLIHAQSKNTEDSIKEVIITFFEGFHKQDTLLIQSLVVENAVLHSVIVDASGETSLKITNFQDFLKSIAAIPKEVIFEEKLYDYKITVNGVLAAITTPYSFYVNRKVSHCGINIFQLYKHNNQWKITHITDSRYKENCS
ncbi:MAG: nuclear transport factor 2 family protein [Flavobacteriales bacterium]|nr:nuclear transport factor 2 family protein [Flavobacteriales bacterium]